jgi:GNAT superfamily N-acetyltransferase
MVTFGGSRILAAASDQVSAYGSPPKRPKISPFGNDQRVIIETRRAGPEDLERASEVLGEAFADYPWTKWTVDPDNHQARITRLQFLALEHLGLAFGEVWLSTLEGTIQSVAVWMDSAVLVPSSVYRALDPAVAHLEGSRHEASRAAEREIEGWRPTQHHFTLAVLGTAPARQREGLGARTLVPGLSTADRQRAGSFLETSAESNLAFYSTFGFEIIGHKRIEGDGPDVWAMYRRHLPDGLRPLGT